MAATGSNKSDNTSIVASQEPETKAILLVYIKTDTLNRYDLIHNLTVNNSTGTVRAETREGLIAASAKYARPEQGNNLRTGQAYSYTDTKMKTHKRYASYPCRKNS